MKKTNSEYRFNISQINKRRALLKNLGRSKSVLTGYKYGNTNMGLIIENKSNQQQFLFAIPNQITIDSQVESIVILLDGTYSYIGEWIPCI